MVDPKSPVFRKSQHPVIPPAVATLFGMVLAEGIHQPKLRESPQTLSFRRREEGLPFPKHRVVHVLRFGRDVEVSANHQWLRRSVTKLEVAADSFEPLHP